MHGRSLTSDGPEGYRTNYAVQVGLVPSLGTTL